MTKVTIPDELRIDSDAGDGNVVCYDGKVRSKAAVVKAYQDWKKKAGA